MPPSLTFDGVNERVHVDSTVRNRRQSLDLRDERDEVFFVFWVTIGLPHVASEQKKTRKSGLGVSECKKTEPGARDPLECCRQIRQVNSPVSTGWFELNGGNLFPGQSPRRFFESDRERLRVF